VLGCTHYPFVIPLIQEIVGPGVRVIDPAPAVARQAGRVLEAMGQLTLPEDPKGFQKPLGSVMRFYTSGDPSALAALLPMLIGASAPVTPLSWDQDLILEEIQK